MADGIRVDVNVTSLQQKFRELPALTKQEVMAAMRVITGKLKAAAETNIGEMFSDLHSATRPGHVHLAQALSTAVYDEGEIVIGEVWVDHEEVPYANILEMGGVIPAHLIKPRNASALVFPTSTLKEFQQGGETTMDEFVVAFQVHHPGGKMAPYYYLLTALTEMAREANNDIELAVIRAINRSGLNSGVGLVKGS